MVLGKLDIHVLKIKLDPCLIPYIKINSIWIKKLNMRPTTAKLLEENRGKVLDIDLGNDFLNVTWKAQTTKINKQTNKTTSNLKAA